MQTDAPLSSILITGAAKRLGRAIAIHLAAHGRRLALHYRSSRAEAEETARLCGERGAATALFAADLGSGREAERLVEEVAAAQGLDVLVNNASVYYPTPLGNVSEIDFDDLMSVNAKGPFFAAQAAARLMRARGGSGAIVNIADADWDAPSPSYIPYMMSKAALVCMTHGMARALAPDVRVNAVAPGAILLPEGTTEKDVQRSLARTPMKRLGTPEDIAAAVEYLIWGAPYATGVVLPVDGGRRVA